jgi:hypothetical protein
MAYATVTDVQERLTRTLTLDEQNVCGSLLDDAAVIIDTYNANASADAKKVVSCRMVIRAIGSGGEQMTPIGATQGSMSALGYSQSWTIGSGSTGELYIGKLEKQLLGAGNKIGSYSPIEALVPVQDEPEVS